MTRVVEFLVGMLPLDRAGRRAVDETLADWRHEASGARTLRDRVAAVARGSTAVAVALASVTTRDAWSAQTVRIVGLVVGAACLMSIGFTLRRFEALASTPVALDLAGPELAGLWASLLPQVLIFTIPLMLLAPPVRNVATRSLMGPGLLLLALAAANLGWIAPQANQWRRQTVAGHVQQTQDTHTGHAPSSRSVTNYNEYTAADLVRTARMEGTDAWWAVATLSSRGAALALVPIALVIGVQARRLARARRWRFGAGLLAYVVALTGWFVAILGNSLVTTLLRGRGFTSTVSFFAMHRGWTIAIGCALVAVALASLAHRAERDHACPPLALR